jgi:hypothetical protein
MRRPIYSGKYEYYEKYRRSMMRSKSMTRIRNMIRSRSMTRYSKEYDVS